MSVPQFVPTADNLYVISYPERTAKEYDFQSLLSQSKTCERNGEVERACNLRYDGVKRLIDLLPEAVEMVLDGDVEGRQVWVG